MKVRLGVVMPIGPGREENVQATVRMVLQQHRPPDAIVLVLDGPDVAMPTNINAPFISVEQASIDIVILSKKHEPGDEQPRNVGVRHLRDHHPDVTHVVFLDSDVLVDLNWTSEMIACAVHHPSAVIPQPYEWLPKGHRNIARSLTNDPRWEMFNENRDQPVVGDLSLGLGCFSGNLVWPIDEFVRVGGFWNEIHHGRCEDGELGLRAVGMGCMIYPNRFARGWHLWHPINTQLAIERNKRDVPMLNDRHPWVEGSKIFMVDRDGKAFDTLCNGCGNMIPTIDWWNHASYCHNATPPTIFNNKD